ncbi:amidohydrolase family protein [Sphingomonas sp. TREG-RG-20F-R18-01]|uniref:amidohydrolase family protein n=1 Tax=Sphingomonas sp. TREG-RG-20F-R18-01 TaxID=2914982 RepID=UPI001F5A88A9|nr:amidohydrolase family protein [Sphingomonas sp. TREG-RG-20F-R18-01]
MTRVIDAHQHFWSLTTPGHSWPTTAEVAIHRDFLPQDLTEATSPALVGTILVQSQPTDQDTDWLIALADRTPLVRAVVGWVDLTAPGAPDRIKALAAAPKLRGLRPMLQSIPDTEWLLQPAIVPALEAMQATGLRLDALVQPRHLEMLARFVERWPDLPIVIDHAAKPDAANGTLDPWRARIATLSRLGVHCKLSGLRTEQARGQPAAALAPYVDHLVSAFGERLMWGSDWPVVLMSGDDWHQWYADARHLAVQAGADVASLFSGAATRFYGIATDDDAAPGLQPHRCAGFQSRRRNIQ